MSPLVIAILGYIMLMALVYLIMKGKWSPAIVFVSLSILLAVVVGYDVKTICDYFKAGLNSVLSALVMFGFAVLFFTIMTQAGLFQPIINFLMRTLGRSTIGLGIGVILVTAVGQLGGAATAAALICIPFFLPLMKKVGLQGKHLMLIFGLTSGIMNLMPWCGPMLRHSAVTGIDAVQLWRTVLPAQIFGLLCTAGIAAYLGIKAKRAASTPTGLKEVAETESATAAEAASVPEKTKLTWKWYFNLALLIVAIYLLVKGSITSYVVMAVVCNIAMIVNFKGQKNQEAVMKSTAGVGYYNLMLLFSTGCFVGIISQGGENSIVYHMATTLLNIMPEFLVKHLHLVMGFLSTPLGFAFPSSAYDTSIVPLCIEMGSRFDIPVNAMSACMAIGKNIFNIGSPTYPSTFFILGLCETELKDYLKYGFVPMWLVGIAMIVFLIIVGMIPV